MIAAGAMGDRRFLAIGEPKAKTELEPLRGIPERERPLANTHIAKSDPPHKKEQRMLLLFRIKS